MLRLSWNRYSNCWTLKTTQPLLESSTPIFHNDTFSGCGFWSSEWLYNLLPQCVCQYDVTITTVTTNAGWWKATVTHNIWYDGSTSTKEFDPKPFHIILRHQNTKTAAKKLSENHWLRQFFNLRVFCLPDLTHLSFICALILPYPN